MLVIDPNSSVRALLGDALKELGFGTIQTLESVKVALGYLEVETVDWILTPLQSSEPVTGMHLLEILSHQEQLEHIRVSMFIGSEEDFCLPMAFALGLMSYHMHDFTRETIRNDLRDLLGHLKDTDDNEVITAAHYLQEFYRNKNDLKSLSSFCENLAAQFPEDGRVLSMLLENRFLTENIEGGKRLLAQMQALGVTGWQTVAEKYLPADSIPLPLLGFRSCLVVDQDELVHNAVRRLLAPLGCDDVVVKTDGEDAFAWLEATKEPPDLIVQEWKLPKLSGPQFVQRVRQRDHHSTPIVVLSSLVTQSDLPLLREMGITRVIAKPLRDEDFVSAMVHVAREEAAPTQHAALEHQIHRWLLANDRPRAAQYKARLLEDAHSPEPLKHYIEGLFLLYDGEYEAARAMAMNAVKQGFEPVKSLTLLGRTFAKLHDYETARKCFERAQSLSPRNIERLCEIATASSLLGDKSAADEAIEQAGKIDGANPAVKEATVKIAVHRGDLDVASEGFKTLESLPRLVADLNNHAVTLIHTHKYDEGIGIYEKILHALPADRSEIRASVSYNLSLAFVRRNELNDALMVLDRLPADGPTEVFAKIRSLRLKVRNAVQTGREVHLLGTPQAGGAGHEGGDNGAAREVRMLSHANPGERCCHLIFYPTAMERRDADRLMSSPPKFQRRQAIEREVGMGIEKMQKQG